jgi:hypothetical protein
VAALASLLERALADVIHCLRVWLKNHATCEARHRGDRWRVANGTRAEGNTLLPAPVHGDPP